LRSITTERQWRCSNRSAWGGSGTTTQPPPTRDRLGIVQETWKRGALGKTFLVRPIAGQIVGEEVVDNAGRVIAVFGLAITNAFLPDPRPQREYREKLQTLLKEL
jgi:hypothetical protein